MSVKIHFLDFINVILVTFMMLHQVVEVSRYLSAYFALSTLFIISTCLYIQWSTNFRNVSRTCLPVFTSSHVLSILLIILHWCWQDHGALLSMIFIPAGVILVSHFIEPVDLFLLLLLDLVLDDVLEANHFWWLAYVVVEESPPEHVLLVHNVFLLVTKVRHHRHAHDLLV